MNETRTDKGEVIAETLRRLGAEDSRSDVVMVGDRSYDVIGARENGLLCVGVSYGYGGREELEAAGAAKVCDTPEELKLLAEDPKEEKKRRDRIKKMKPERIPWLTRGESGTGIFAPKEKKAENIKEKRTAKTEPKTEEIVIPIQRKLWRLLKPLLTYELFLIGATVLLALILMTFTTGGYLEERMHATSVLASAIGSLAAIPVLWKQYKKDEGMFPKPEKRWSAAEAAACILLVMTFGHLLNTVMNVTGFTRIFSGYQDMASKIYEQGLIVSDDMEMGAMAKHYAFADMGVMAIKAGADMVLVCHEYAHERETYDGLLKEYKSNAEFRALVDEKVTRIVRTKLNHQ